jgi:tetracycline resistance efflux pump
VVQGRSIKFVAVEAEALTKMVAPTFLSVIPPLFVLVFGITTRRVATALVLGLGLAALCATGGAPLESLTLLFSRLWQTMDLESLMHWDTIAQSQTALIAIFLVNLGILISLLSATGCAQAYADAVSRSLKSARDVEQASLLLSMVLVIDDYFSTLTTGTVMRPLANRFRVAPVKMAFLIDSMAAPIAIIVPLSSWLAVIIGQLNRAGISEHVGDGTTIIADPFVTYLSFIPYIFYSSILMASAWFIVRWRIAFGPMKKHEAAYITQERVTPVRKPRREKGSAVPTLFDFITPIVLFMITVVVCLLLSGGYTFSGGFRAVVAAIANSESALALAIGSIVSLTLSVLFLWSRGLLQVKQYASALIEGSTMMAPAMQILLLCWTFGAMLTSDLGTGVYLAQIFSHAIPLWALPVVFFAASSAISFSLGSSWGTLGIVVPIAVPMVLTMSNLICPVAASEVIYLLPVLGAIISGAVLGDHISPLSDTTIMSSTSSGSVHIEHVYTQFFYIAPVFVATAASFVLVGLFPFAPWWMFAGIGTAISCSLLLLLNTNHPEKGGSDE